MQNELFLQVDMDVPDSRSICLSVLQQIRVFDKGLKSTDFSQVLYCVCAKPKEQSGSKLTKR